MSSEENQKCQLHVQNDIRVVCFSSQCQEQNKLLCCDCISSHSGHLKFIDINELDKHLIQLSTQAKELAENFQNKIIHIKGKLLPSVQSLIDQREKEGLVSLEQKKQLFLKKCQIHEQQIISYCKQCGIYLCFDCKHDSQHLWIGEKRYFELLEKSQRNFTSTLNIMRDKMVQLEKKLNDMKAVVWELININDVIKNPKQMETSQKILNLFQFIQKKQQLEAKIKKFVFLFESSVEKQITQLSIKCEFVTYDNKIKAENEFKIGIEFFLQSSQETKAIEKFDQVLKLNPYHFEALYYKGHSLNNQQKYSESLKCLEQALFLNKNYLKCQALKGICLFTQGKHEETFKWLDECIQNQKNQNSACYLSGINIIYLQFDLRKKLQDAQKSLVDICEEIKTLEK